MFFRMGFLKLIIMSLKLHISTLLNLRNFSELNMHTDINGTTLHARKESIVYCPSMVQLHIRILKRVIRVIIHILAGTHHKYLKKITQFTLRSTWKNIYHSILLTSLLNLNQF
jgi:hypothetical protein